MGSKLFSVSLKSSGGWQNAQVKGEDFPFPAVSKQYKKIIIINSLIRGMSAEQYLSCPSCLMETFGDEDSGNRNIQRYFWTLLH